jgi:hypothetical protein
MADGVGVEIDTDGIAVMVRYLRKVEPELARILPREMRGAAAPIVQTARALVPQPTALRNWGAWTERGRDRSWTRKARTGIVAQTDVRATGERNQINLLSLFQKDPAGAIFDNAGRHSAGATGRSGAFLQNLNDKYGDPTQKGRYMWPAVEQNLGYLNREVQRVIDKWSQELEKALDRAA